MPVCLKNVNYRQDITVLLTFKNNSFARNQHLHRHLVIHPVAGPGRNGSFRSNVQAFVPVRVLQDYCVSAETRFGARWYDFSTWQREVDDPAWVDMNAKPAFMHQPIVFPAT